jgi:hypothetical protein
MVIDGLVLVVMAHLAVDQQLAGLDNGRYYLGSGNTMNQLFSDATP